ncbi:MAG: 23S rRNA (pseudouridine(1915)-N(3))-methyltransferase RlmH [Lachnospiraceae bacterium]|nr:23S rRNA (pseudouridine(1915)-N(3))-methyltransferase RlmH [Lachnospiraceae bacterium]
MEINIYVPCKKIEKHYNQALSEYIKRSSPWCKINIIALKSYQKLATKKGAKVYLVTSGKNTPSSPELATLINDLNVSGYSCIDFILDDNSQDIIKNLSGNDIFVEEFNLSSFQMGEQLTAVVLTEQLYRAFTIQKNITYHK